MSKCATLPLTIRKGVTFRHSFIYEDADGQAFNLTDYRARLQIKATRSGDDLDEQVLYATLDSDVPADGTITFLPAVDGKINLAIPALVTKEFTWETAEYDLLLIYPNGVDVDLILEGQVTMLKTVTEIP